MIIPRNNEFSKLTKAEIVRAWESPEFRKSLTSDQLKLLPANPAGRLNFAPAQKETFKAAMGTSDTGCYTYTSSCTTRDSGCTTYTSGCTSYDAGCRPNTNYCYKPG